MTARFLALFTVLSLLAGCSGSDRGSSQSDDALRRSTAALGPAFACAADLTSTGDAVAITGNFKSADDATAYSSTTVELATERDGWVQKYTVRNGNVSEGGSNSSMELLKGYVRDGKLELSASQKLENMNCFNVTKDGSNTLAEVHICFEKSAGTHDAKGFVVTDLISGDSFDAADCR
jgi:hypothetical protein